MRIDRIKFAAALAKADISCLELAEKSQLSRVTITNVKSGKSCSKKTAQLLAAGLGVNLADILPDRSEVS